MKKSVIFGDIITMDEKRPFAKAAFVKDGFFMYIGGAAEAKKLAGADAQILDYGENFVYPGFLEAHCHEYFAGYRAVGQANLSTVAVTDYDEYRRIIKEFIAQNPDREFYMAGGWIENDQYVTKAYLDEICADKPLIMQTGGGHSMLLNTKALEWALGHWKTIIGTFACLLVVALVMFFTLGRSFLPAFNEGSFTIAMSSVPGISLEESDKLGLQAEEILMGIFLIGMSLTCFLINAKVRFYCSKLHKNSFCARDRTGQKH